MMQGILLAAGYGRRFDPSGRSSKLLAALADGRSVAWHAARALCSALPGSIAVIRPGHAALAEVLRDAGCRVLESHDAERGMGSALAHAVRETAGADGWLVALADMPWLPPDTIARVARAIDHPLRLAAAFHDGRRGHPAAFGAAWYPLLSELDGDQGARSLLAGHEVVCVDSPDDGVLRDVDRPADLTRPLSGRG
ncbi:nucleotidyltransferase family protein [Methyloversatilis thermotolerans]|uniref:nucleotidyltransferase family protein n=1 Tax=Methyloversatilis thermotolerans TaxID=1346290 RepID=UPI000365012F|nr:nucleotidyltransferase family protein [Methyloversatilis thermotolerans]